MITVLWVIHLKMGLFLSDVPSVMFATKKLWTPIIFAVFLVIMISVTLARNPRIK